jgi:hypothetical protein
MSYICPQRLDFSSAYTRRASPSELCRNWRPPCERVVESALQGHVEVDERQRGVDFETRWSTQRSTQLEIVSFVDAIIFFFSTVEA